MKKTLANIQSFYASRLRPVLQYRIYHRILKSSDLPKTILTKYLSQRYNNSFHSICLAPFNSLYLSIDGNYIPCCVNRKTKLGMVNSQDISDVWSGQAISELRNSLRKYRFPENCYSCKNHFMNSNYSAMGSERYDHLPILKNQPSELVIEFSDDCNYNCIMCKGSETDWLSNLKNCEGWKPDTVHIIKQIESLLPNLHSITFIGGEPFIIEEYFPIWEKIIEINPHCIIDVQTNGSILNDRIKNIIERGHFRIGISIDSLDDNTYSKIRTGGNLRVVLENFKYYYNYAKRKSTNIYIAICPMVMNWQEIPALIRFGNSYNANIFLNTMMEPGHLSLFHLPHNRLLQIIAFLENEKMKFGNYTEMINKRKFVAFLQELKLWNKQKEKIKQEYLKGVQSLEKVSLEKTLNILKTKYIKCFAPKNDEVNIDFSSPFNLYTNCLLKTFPHDIILKKLLVRIAEVPDHKFIEIAGNNNLQELMEKSNILYREILAEYIENIN